MSRYYILLLAVVICPTLSITKNMSTTYTKNTTKVSTDKRRYPNITLTAPPVVLHFYQDFTLDKFCQVFEIPIDQCSCEITEFVCEVTNFEKDVHRNRSSRNIFQRWHGVTVFYASVAVVSSIFGIVGNAAVIAMAWRQRSQMSPCKLHIAELAVVNLIFSAVQTVNVVPLYWTNTWIYGKVLCKIMKGTLEMGSLLSSGFFQLISVERYFLIVSTFNIDRVKGFCQRYKHILLGMNLVLVSVTIIPYIQGVNIEEQSDRCVTIIGENKWMGPLYTWLTFLVYSVLPIIVASVLARKLTSHFAQQEASLTMVSRADVNKKVMSNMLLVLFLFIICTLPSRLVPITMEMVDFQSHNILLGFQFTSYTLYSLQGTLNPILYSMLAREWRKDLCKVVTSVFRRSKRDQGSGDAAGVSLNIQFHSSRHHTF